MKLILEKWNAYSQKCKNDKDQSGTAVVKKTETGEVESCHTSLEKAKSAVKARYANYKSESIEEVSTMAGGSVSGAGQGVPFGNKEEILADNEKEKKVSRLKNVEEQYSTAGLKPDSRNGYPLEDEFKGFQERSAMQGLKNVPRASKVFKIKVYKKSRKNR